MVDNRFDGYPTDGRFPSPGVDTYHGSYPVDGRFPSPGEDTRFGEGSQSGITIGDQGDGTSIIITAGDPVDITLFDVTDGTSIVGNAVVVSNPIANQSMTLGDPDRTINLATVFSYADDYSVVGASASVSDSSLILSAAAELESEAITVTATNAATVASDAFTFTVTVAKPVVVSPIGNQNFTLDGETATEQIDLNAVFSGADSYLVVETTNSATIVDSVLYMDVSGEINAETITVRAINNGGSVEDAFILNVVVPAPILISEISDRTLTVGTGNEIIDLDGVFAYAESYEAAGTGATVTNSNLSLSTAEILTDEPIVVTAINEVGQTDTDFTLTVVAAADGLTLIDEGDGTSTVTSPADPVNIQLIDQGDGTSVIAGDVAPINTNLPEIYLLPPDTEIEDNSSLGITQTGTPTWAGADSSSWDWYNAEGIMPGTTDADTIAAGAPHSAAYYVVAQATNQYGTTTVQSNVVNAAVAGVLTVTPIVGDALEITATLQGACYYGWYEDGTAAFDPAALIRGDDAGQVAGGEAGMFVTIGTLADATIDTAALAGGTTYVLAIVLDINDAQGNDGYSNIATQDYTA